MAGGKSNCDGCDHLTDKIPYPNGKGEFPCDECYRRDKELHPRFDDLYFRSHPLFKKQRDASNEKEREE